MNSNQSLLNQEVLYLAESAFERKLISGYGDSSSNNEFQIVYQGKPRHLSLEEAHAFLVNLLFSDSVNAKDS
ncbi:MAG: hypothetical protein HC908_12080 [Calothrix sp. SM1_7_51]|nr:hypothetical protein [Calothrix sp. SM1_7_51]